MRASTNKFRSIYIPTDEFQPRPWGWRWHKCMPLVALMTVFVVIVLAVMMFGAVGRWIF